jgi:hypothetical protein
MKVYCVFQDFGWEGEILKHIFAKEEDADAFIASNTDLYNKKKFYVI